MPSTRSSLHFAWSRRIRFLVCAFAALKLSWMTCFAAQTSGPEGEFVSYCIEHSGQVLKLDRKFMVVGSTTVEFNRGTNIASLTPDGNWLFVGGYSYYNNSTPLYRIDTRTMEPEPIDVPNLPLPSGEPSHSAAALIAVSKDLVYYRAIGFESGKSCTFLIHLDTMEVNNVEGFSLLSPDRMSMSPDGTRMVVVGSSIKLIDTSTAKVLAEYLTNEQKTTLNKAGDTLLHGMNVDWNAETLGLWRTRRIGTEENRMESVNIDFRTNMVNEPREPSPWPNHRFPYRDEMARDNRSRFLAVVNRISTKSELDFPATRPVLSLSEATLIASKPRAFWDNQPRDIGICFFSPDSELLFTQTAITTPEDDSQGQAGDGGHIKKFKVVVIETETWRVVAALPLDSGLVQVLFRCS